MPIARAPTPPAPSGPIPGSWVSITSGFRAGWEIPSFADGLAGDVFPLQYRLFDDGTVELRGTVEKTGAGAGAAIVDLPDEIRPPTDIQFAGVADSASFPNGAPASFSLQSSSDPTPLNIKFPAAGDVNLNGLVSFSGIYYNITAL